MGTVWKNEKQTEFCALLLEMENAGYTKAAVANMLGISPAAVTQFFTGKSTPKGTTLALMHHIVNDVLGKKRETKKDQQSVPRDAVHRKLEDLKERDSKAYDSVRNTIEVLHDRIKVDRIAEEAGRKAIASVTKPGVTIGGKEISSNPTPTDKVAELGHDVISYFEKKSRKRARKKVSRTEAAPPNSTA